MRFCQFYNYKLLLINDVKWIDFSGIWSDHIDHSSPTRCYKVFEKIYISQWHCTFFYFNLIGRKLFQIARIFFDLIGPWIGFPSRMLKRRNERNLTQDEIDKEAEDEDNKLSQLIEGVMQQYSSEATKAYKSENGRSPQLNRSAQKRNIF